MDKQKMDFAGNRPLGGDIRIGSVGGVRRVTGLGFWRRDFSWNGRVQVAHVKTSATETGRPRFGSLPQDNIKARLARKLSFTAPRPLLKSLCKEKTIWIGTELLSLHYLKDSSLTKSPETDSMEARSTLIELFELLEDYAPAWYSEEHRRRAMEALGQSADYRSMVGGSSQSSFSLSGSDGQGAEQIRRDKSAQSCRLLSRRG